MSFLVQYNQEVNSKINAAKRQINACISRECGLWLFNALLKKVRNGIRVDLIIRAEILNQLDLNPRYFTNLIQEGGRHFTYQSTPSTIAARKGIRSSFLLIDGATIIHEPNIREQSTETIISDDLTQVSLYQNYFKFLSEEGVMNIPQQETHNNQQQERNIPYQKNKGFATGQIPVALSFLASPKSVLAGGVVALSWAVQDADYVEILPDIGKVAPIGEQLVKINDPTEFRLIAHCQGEQFQKLISVTVNYQLAIHYRLTTIDPKTEEELILQGQPDLPHHYGIIKGQAITLNWDIQHADLVYLDGQGPLPKMGAKTFCPDQLTAYTLHAIKGGVPHKRIIVVNVFEVPAIKSIHQVPSPKVTIQSSLNYQPPPLPVINFEQVKIPIENPISMALDQLDEETRQELNNRWEATQKKETLWQQLKGLFKREN